jgi:hypothetical protein
MKGTECVWEYEGEEDQVYVWFPDQDSLCFQEFSVKFSFWSVLDTVYSLWGGP